MNLSDLQAKNQPTKYAKIFKKHKIRYDNVAKFTGYSFSYISNIINGIRPMQPHIQDKFDEIVAMCEAAEAKNNG